MVTARREESGVRMTRIQVVMFQWRVVTDPINYSATMPDVPWITAPHTSAGRLLFRKISGGAAL